jgi:hypothetical protein
MNCQIQSIPILAEGNAPSDSLSIKIRIKLFLKRNINSQTKRSVKKYSDHVFKIFSSTNNKLIEQSYRAAASTRTAFATGDFVCVRSREEVESTLDNWGELKGCRFFEDMWKYCSTVQCVLKAVERFVDERDYRVKKARGLFILDGLICEGTPDFGRCDRACYYFWREEWLEMTDRESVDPEHL